MLVDCVDVKPARQHSLTAYLANRYFVIASESVSELIHGEGVQSLSLKVQPCGRISGIGLTITAFQITLSNIVAILLRRPFVSESDFSFHTFNLTIPLTCGNRIALLFLIHCHPCSAVDNPKSK